jgi:hypothetical protein
MNRWVNTALRLFLKMVIIALVMLLVAGAGAIFHFRITDRIADVVGFVLFVGIFLFFSRILFPGVYGRK